MATRHRKELKVRDVTINVSTVNDEDYLSLTDMVKTLENGSAVVENWLRNKNTVEFLGVWEVLNNPGFNSLEFEGIKNQAGSNRFAMSAKQWIGATGAIGIRAQAGRYGGTYAHKDIAFEFAAWVSPEFKLMIIKEFQRLKAEEQALEHWDYRRFLSKVNYKLQTNAVRNFIIPMANVPKNNEWLMYAEEADIINLALFGCTAKDWRAQNPKLAKGSSNIRDQATVHQLTVLSNLESLNSMLISQGAGKPERFRQLQAEAQRQLTALQAVVSVLSPPGSKRLLDEG
ncbi:MAG TPA: KilA-N domain-containing protein [Candidatus Saccharimonadales bacterium]|nr:KilA-N domain-containing protein [Candidatus Saccharimonadales bacterium]